MNIQDLKSNTTWQEASNTINNNNNKISLAIATLENATLKNKGYFTTVEKLNEAIPNPTIGSKAYVGTSEPYAIYIVENGVWVDSGYTGGNELVAKITTDRIEDGAVTSNKISTSAFDSTLSVSGKIAPANVVGSKLTELGEKVGGLQQITSWEEGNYLDNSGKLTALANMRISTPKVVKKGLTVYAKGAGTGICVIAKHKDGVYTPLVLMNSSDTKDYQYTVTDDCEVVVSGRCNREVGNVEAFVETETIFVEKVDFEELQKNVVELSGQIHDINGGHVEYALKNVDYYVNPNKTIQNSTVSSFVAVYLKTGAKISVTGVGNSTAAISLVKTDLTGKNNKEIKDSVTSSDIVIISSQIQEDTEAVFDYTVREDAWYLLCGMVAKFKAIVDIPSSLEFAQKTANFAYNATTCWASTNNNDLNGIRCTGNRVVVNANGFSFIYNGKLYYIAPADRKTVTEFTSPVGSTRAFLVLDPTKLENENGRNEPNIVMSVVNDKITDNHIVVAAWNGVAKYWDFNYYLSAFKHVKSDSVSNSAKRMLLFEPSFYAHKKGRINDVEGVGKSWYDRLRVLHISDVHGFSKYIPEVFELAKGKANIVINTGDDANGTASTPSDTNIQVLTEIANAVNSEKGSTPYLVTKGNHDVPNMTLSQYRELMLPLMPEGFITGSSTRMYGYYDLRVNDTVGTVRFVVLDMFDYNDGEFGTTKEFQSCNFSQSQINWLITTMKDAVSKGYAVITIGHYCFGDAESFAEDAYPDVRKWYQDPYMIPDIIYAMQKGEQLNKVYNDIMVNENFSGMHLKFLCHMYGHIHSKNWYQCKKSDGSKLYDIVMIGEDALAEVGTALNKEFREPNTVNEIGCSVLEIDPIEEAIYRVAYGSYIHYDGSESERVTKIPCRFL